MHYSDITFSQAEFRRYNRHIVIPDFGLEAQKKLKFAKVLVVGAGGLGSPLLTYLAASGIGTIGIIDFDTVSESNLHRQVLFSIEDIGKSKVEVAKLRLETLNPYITVKIYNALLTPSNALEIIREYDVVADGSDNFPTRYLVNDACVLLQKPNVYASIFQFEGHLTVFNYKNGNGVSGPNYRDLYMTPPPAGLVPNCGEAGVLGVLPGIMGSLQACEVMKIVTGVGDVLDGRLFLFDALKFETHILKIKRRSNNPLTDQNSLMNELVDYEQFCEIKIESEIKKISATQLMEWQKSGDFFQLIDVREQEEYNILNIGADLIPIGTILNQVDKIAVDRPVVIHCESGQRSINAIIDLQKAHGFDNLYNLEGGILAYLNQAGLHNTEF